MFPEQDIDDFMYNMQDNTNLYEDFTVDELTLHIASLKMMQKVAEQGKMVWNFDQEWLM